MSLSAVTTLQMVENNLAKAKSTTADDPQVKRETDYFLGNIGNIGNVKTSQDFVNNYRLFSYAMTAYGLSNMTYAKAFMQKVVDGGVTNTKSMANTLTDPRFKAFAEAFDFGDDGANATTDATINAGTTDRYVEQTLENNVGDDNQGAQLALYFQNNAPDITSSYQILGDPALLKFVQTAFDIPQSSGTTIEQDAAAVDKKLNVADLQDPAKVQKLVQRFAAMWDLQNSDPTATSPALEVLGATASGSNGLDDMLVTSLQAGNLQNLFAQF